MSLVVQCADEVSTQPLALMGIQFHTHSRNHVPNGLLRLNLDREKKTDRIICVFLNRSTEISNVYLQPVT